MTTGVNELTLIYLRAQTEWFATNSNAHVTHLLQLPDDHFLYLKLKPTIFFIFQGETLARKSTSSCHCGATLTASFWIQRLRLFVMSTIRPSAFCKYQGKRAHTHIYPLSINYWFNSRTHTQTPPVRIIQQTRPRIERSKQINEAFDSQTLANYRCGINGENDVIDNHAERGCRAGCLLYLSAGVPRQPHTQSAAAAASGPINACRISRNLSPRNLIKRVEIVILMTVRVQAGYWHSCAHYSKHAFFIGKFPPLADTNMLNNLYTLYKINMQIFFHMHP